MSYEHRCAYDLGNWRHGGWFGFDRLRRTPGYSICGACRGTPSRPRTGTDAGTSTVSSADSYTDTGSSTRADTYTGTVACADTYSGTGTSTRADNYTGTGNSCTDTAPLGIEPR